jgi:uncharacterized protein YunC (DUF1805 family)
MLSKSKLNVIFALAGFALCGSLMLTATPSFAAEACMINGEARTDIDPDDCLEAQRTGCVRSKLSAAQYKDCLRVVKAAKKTSEFGCRVAGVLRQDILPADCVEAQETGCIRRLLSKQAYKNCLDAQPQ